jgi:ATP-binding cassette, subfamily B, bacterial
MVCFLFRHLRGYRFLIVIAIALTFAQVGASLLLAFPLKFILDKLVNHRDPHFPLAGLVLGLFDQLAPSPGGAHSALAIILFATTLLVALGLLSASLSYVQLYLAAFIRQNLSARLRQKLFDHLQHLSLSWHGQQKTGDLMQRLIGNTVFLAYLNQLYQPMWTRTSRPLHPGASASQRGRTPPCRLAVRNQLTCSAVVRPAVHPEA